LYGLILHPISLSQVIVIYGVIKFSRWNGLNGVAKLVTVVELKQKLGSFRFYALLLLMLAGTTYGGFQWGNVNFQMQQQEIATLNQTLENLDKENNELTKKLNILGVELEVGKVANMTAQNTIQQHLQKEVELRREIGFYQKVMAPELKDQGFVIDAFNVEHTLSEEYYRFELVLMQQDAIKSVVKGNVEVIVQGSEKGKPTQISMSELLGKGAAPLTFSFKYFQVVEGEFRLPPDFKPEKVVVKAEIFQFKRKRGDLEKSFSWLIESSGDE
jgi:hypothetical protein